MQRRVDESVAALEDLEQKLHKQATILAKASVACTVNEAGEVGEGAQLPTAAPPTSVTAIRARRAELVASMQDVSVTPLEPASNSSASVASAAELESLRTALLRAEERIVALERERDSMKRQHKAQLMAAEREISRLVRIKNSKAVTEGTDQHAPAAAAAAPSAALEHDEAAAVADVAMDV